MTREEEIRKAASFSNMISNDFVRGARWADRTMIERLCRCYCDDICEKGMSNMCFYKHDHKGQVKNDFTYKECNELKLLHHAAAF